MYRHTGFAKVDGETCLVHRPKIGCLTGSANLGSPYHRIIGWVVITHLIDSSVADGIIGTCKAKVISSEGAVWVLAHIHHEASAIEGVSPHSRAVDVKTKRTTSIARCRINHCIECGNIRISCEYHAGLAIFSEVIDMTTKRLTGSICKLALIFIEIVCNIHRSSIVVVHKPTLGVAGIDLGGSVGNTKAAGIHSLGYQLLGELLFEF